MGYLIAVIISVTLLVLFLLLTAREAHTGTRLFGNVRSALDERLRDTAFFVRQINLALILAHAVRSFLEHLAHEVVQVVLAGVHALERLLIRTIHTLQRRKESVKTLHAETHLEEVVTTIKRTLRADKDGQSEKDSVE